MNLGKFAFFAFFLLLLACLVAGGGDHHHSHYPGDEGDEDGSDFVIIDEGDLGAENPDDGNDGDDNGNTDDGNNDGDDNEGDDNVDIDDGNTDDNNDDDGNDGNDGDDGDDGNNDGDDNNGGVDDGTDDTDDGNTDDNGGDNDEVSSGNGGNNGGNGPATCTAKADCGRSQFAACCGGRCIDTRRTNCISNIRCPNTTNAVCGTKCYNTARFGCHNKAVLCRIGQNLCGDDRCYDPATTYCAGNSRLCDSKTRWYCPETNQCYNPQAYYCCPTAGKLCPIGSLRWKNNTCCPQPPKVQPGCNRINPLQCGPKKCYNPSISSCYSTTQTVCRIGLGVCGSRCYNASTSYCPDSQNLCRNNQWFCSEAGKCFDPKTQFCCSTRGKVCGINASSCCSDVLGAGRCRVNNDCTLGIRTSTRRCCGSRCIDGSRNTCVRGRACPLGSDGVCGTKCYNTSTQGCWDNRLLCPIGLNLCGNRCFNPERSYCAGSTNVCPYGQWFCAEARQCYDPKTQTCCGAEKKLCPRVNNNATNNNNGNGTNCCTVNVARGCNRLNPLQCGNRCYSPSTSACYNNQTVCAYGSGVCGSRCYNTTRSYCPDGVTLCSTGQWFCSEASTCFNPQTQFCCASRRKVCNLREAASCCPNNN